jgi:biopolymer transport protein ExbD
MNFKRRARPVDSEERILPLINVVFLLLIFFMLAGRLSEPAPFAVAPPKSSEAAAALRPPEGSPGEATILLAADGRLALDGMPVDAAVLRERLSARLADHPRLPVSLKADGAVEAARVVAVMEGLRAVGVHELQLFAEAAPGAAVAAGLRP